MMVKNVVLSEYSSNPPVVAGRVKILGTGPLYQLTRVQAIAANENQLKLWTQKCIHDVNRLFDSDLAQVAELVACLKESDYIDSEWCENGRLALVACDAYRIRRTFVAQATGKRMPIEYFLKFAIGKTGNLVLMVSCHV